MSKIKLTFNPYGGTYTEGDSSPVMANAEIREWIDNLRALFPVSPKSGTIYVDEEADTATLYYWLSNLRSSFVTGIKGTYPTPSHERTLKEALGR